MKILKALLLPALFLAIFFSVALWRYFATGKIFYVYNFGYIGIAMALGLFLSNILPKEKLGVARRVAQLLIGVYLLGYVGILSREDLQIEGFWLYLFSGYFAGATLHYFVAKIAGPLIFNRGWCGWACWTAMVLDFLPWKKPRHEVNERYTAIRYAHFMIVLLSVVFLFYFTDFGQGFRKKDTVELYWLIIGNFMYYAIGIILAAALRDNRAFCKYACPIPALMKIGAVSRSCATRSTPQNALSARSARRIARCRYGYWTICEKACASDPPNASYAKPARAYVPRTRYG